MNEIRWVDDDEPATTQMREFAVRMHQPGIPLLARDYLSSRIDRAAMAHLGTIRASRELR